MSSQTPTQAAATLKAQVRPFETGSCENLSKIIMIFLLYTADKKITSDWIDELMARLSIAKIKIDWWDLKIAHV